MSAIWEVGKKYEIKLWALCTDGGDISERWNAKVVEVASPNALYSQHGKYILISTSSLAVVRAFE